MPPRPTGTGPRLSAQEITSTLTRRRSSAVLLCRGPPGLLSQFLSHSFPFTAVHWRPRTPACAAHGRWRTPVNAGQHCWKACKGQPFRSSNLLSSATLTCKNIDECPLPNGLIVSSGLISWAHLPSRGARRCRNQRVRWSWSEASRTAQNGGTHAVKACALPFRAGWDRSRPAGYPPTGDHITLSDREVPGERAPTRRSGRQHGCRDSAGRRAGKVVLRSVLVSGLVQPCRATR